MRRAATLPLAAALVLVLAACAVVPPALRTTVPAAPEEVFVVDGRLSARQGTQVIAASFAWTHAAPRDAFVVTTPFGQTVAELEGDASVPRVDARLADGRRESARDWAELTTRAVGFELPVAWLTAWVRAAPHAEAPHSAEIDAAGRVGVLRQNGWEIVYGYPDGSSARPSRLRLASADVEIAIVVDRWGP